MKYFIDTEFRERPNIIDLISIGIVSEDGRAYYAISKEFDLRTVWNDDWLRENVLKSIFDKYNTNHAEQFTRSNMLVILKSDGKTNKEIASEIISFVTPEEPTYSNGIGLNQVVRAFTQADAWTETYYPKEFEYIRKHNTFIPDTVFSTGVDGKGEERNRARIYNRPEFYGYYADYDWVVFCWLFGRMINLPKGFPMYCRDIKQMMDERGLDKQWKGIHCPDPEGEHDALTDAEWNRKLYGCIVNNDKTKIDDLSVPSTSYVKEIIRLSKLSAKTLRELNLQQDRLYTGKELTREELIYQLAFKMDAPIN